MSTVRLKKDYTDPAGTRHKPGAAISVPFGVGQRLVADGDAEYPNAPAPVVPPPAPPGEVAKLKAEHAAAVKKMQDDHAAEVARLKADLDAAEKLAAEAAKKK